MDSEIKKKEIGYCIYCGKKENLEDEHALARSLNGAFVLANGSCRECASITSKFELIVTRGLLSEYRAYKGFKSRSKHSKFKNEKEWTYKDKEGNTKKELMPLNSVGIFLGLPRFAEPRYFVENPKIKDREIESIGIELFSAVAKPHKRKPEIKEVLIKNDFPMKPFLQFLCKTALCFTHLTYDKSKFDSFITEFILGRDDVNITRYIGSTNNPLLTGKTKEIILYEKNGILYCDMKLFDDIETVYRVIVGRLK